MNKKMILPLEYANDISKALGQGCLLNTKVGDKFDSMVIGWGGLGICMGATTFTVYVRQGRFTREQLDANPKFTVSVPLGHADANIIKKCGRMSGRKADKVYAAGLTLVDPEIIDVPAVKEFPLTLECEVIFRQEMPLENISDVKGMILRNYYPQDVDSDFTGSNKDPHVMYIGQITAAYIIED